uniref:Glycosyltransferase n=1 Tax=Kalanchoe fedtschenkoi TaxID=63787 RepID=A0A7N0RGY8_KALFE
MITLHKPLEAATMTKSIQLIIIPTPVVGHLVSFVQFADTLLRRDDRLSISVLLINLPLFSDPVFTKKLSASHPSINFIDLPPLDFSLRLASPPMAPEAFISSIIELHKPSVKAAVENLILLPDDDRSSLRFVVDMFCTSMIDVARDFGAPCYTFFTSSAAFLGLLDFISTHHLHELTEAGPDSMMIPSYASPVPASVLPHFVFLKDGCDAFAAHGRRIKETDGVILNTFADLEPHALASFAEGYPPLYPVGPILDLARAEQMSEARRAESERILRWLDAQEEESVVFLCFGSMGSFKADQVAEIAAGLESTGVKFLWALRKRPQGIYDAPGEYEDPSEVLPEGFLARTEARGLICGWAPQVEILAHKSVGGFVTHCGWNSTLESIWFGVPTVAWPLYAEQQINAFQMVKDLGLAIELKIDYNIFKDALVPAAEIENAVRLLMAKDGYGLEIRKRVKDMSERSRAAVAAGGSSFETIGALINKMLN